MAGVSLAALIQGGDRVQAYCLNVRGPRPCSHSAPFDPAPAAARRGPAIKLYDRALQRRLVCRICGSRGASFVLAPPLASLGAGGSVGR